MKKLSSIEDELKNSVTKKEACIFAAPDITVAITIQRFTLRLLYPQCFTHRLQIPLPKIAEVIMSSSNAAMKSLESGRDAHKEIVIVL